MSREGRYEKRYDPKDTSLRFVDRPDDLDPMCKCFNMILRFTDVTLESSVRRYYTDISPPSVLKAI